MRKLPKEAGRAADVWRSPIGWVGVVAGGAGLIEVHSHPDSSELRQRLLERYPEALMAREGFVGQAIGQLEEYFLGSRQHFDLPLDFRGLSPFSVTTLRNLCDVPFGQTLTYGELAARCGSAHGARAIGRIMAANPFPIVIPCHRVVGAGGKLRGYSGGEGVPTKEWLLRFEAQNATD